MSFGTKLTPRCDSVVSETETCRRIVFNIERRLEQLGKTWSWLAVEIGTYRSFATNMITGKRLISANRLANIAAALDISMDELHRPIKDVRLKRNAAS